MILLFLSLFRFSADIRYYQIDTLFAPDINLSLVREGGWFKGIVEGGLRSDFTSGGKSVGISDILIGAGVKRNVRGVNISCLPMVRFPVGSEGLIRNFSIGEYGYGIGMGLEYRLFGLYLDIETRAMEFTSQLREVLFTTRAKFNPDTLTFGLDFSFGRFMKGNDRLSSIYITPTVTLTRWSPFVLSLGIDFRLSEADEIMELDDAGITTGNIGMPPWQVSFRITSKEKLQKRVELIQLRIILLNDKEVPVDGLLSLADSGSFEIREGEIMFHLPHGIYPISIYREEHVPIDTIVILKETTDLMFVIHPRKAFGRVEGKVVDIETNMPLYAQLRFGNGEGRVFFTNPGDGCYRGFLPTGDYIIRISTEGYFTHTAMVEVFADSVTVLDFKMLPSMKKWE